MKKELYEQLTNMLGEALAKETKESWEKYFEENPPLRYIGKFSYKALLHDAPREVGFIANTENVFYFYDGNSWLIMDINNICHFNVKDRGYVRGRGYYTVIDNEENLPITLESTIRKGLKSLKIVGIEMIKGATGVLPSWSLITREKTEGDIITVDLDGERTLDKILKGKDI